MAQISIRVDVDPTPRVPRSKNGSSNHLGGLFAVLACGPAVSQRIRRWCSQRGCLKCRPTRRRSILYVRPSLGCSHIRAAKRSLHSGQEHETSDKPYASVHFLLQNTRPLNLTKLGGRLTRAPQDRHSSTRLRPRQKSRRQSFEHKGRHVASLLFLVVSQRRSRAAHSRGLR